MLTLITNDTNIYRSKQLILGHKRVKIQNINVNNLLLNKTLNLRALSRPVVNQVIKPKQKKGITFVRQQLQSFAKDLTSYQTFCSKKSLLLIVCQSYYMLIAHRSKT